MNKVKTFSQAVLCVLLCYPLVGLTLSTDRNQPIDIQADKLDINDKQHISIYQGHVVMRQGSLHIRVRVGSGRMAGAARRRGRRSSTASSS